ncbi:MAG: hypothetical protein M3R25_08960 [Bacteroidota bacterium]|nr:hypothetical protein [Bacteroidota bacterium]
MTLGEFFDWTSSHPGLLVAYFLVVPFIALLAGMFGKGQGHLSPWKYVYSTLIYLVSIPGIFAVTLSIYLFLFERRSIMDTNLLTQVLPIMSMVTTFMIIRHQVSLDKVPGFDRLSGLILILATLISLMWIIDKTHIYAIAFMPFYLVILILLAGFFVIRLGLKRFAK